jgi:hypothetical protein
VDIKTLTGAVASAAVLSLAAGAHAAVTITDINRTVSASSETGGTPDSETFNFDVLDELTADADAGPGGGGSASVGAFAEQVSNISNGFGTWTAFGLATLNLDESSDSVLSAFSSIRVDFDITELTRVEFDATFSGTVDAETQREVVLRIVRNDSPLFIENRLSSRSSFRTIDYGLTLAPGSYTLTLMAEASADSEDVNSGATSTTAQFNFNATFVPSPAPVALFGLDESQASEAMRWWAGRFPKRG